MEINANIIELPEIIDLKKLDVCYEDSDYIRCNYNSNECEILFDYCINWRNISYYNKVDLYNVKLRKQENNFILKLPNEIKYGKTICILDLLSNNQYSFPLKFMYAEEFKNGLKKLSGIIYKNKLLYRINNMWSIKKYEFI